jgi:hypothetical protein
VSRILVTGAASGALVLACLSAPCVASAASASSAAASSDGSGTHTLAGAGGAADTAWVQEIHWTARSLAPGVKLLRGSFTSSGPHPDWTVTIQAPTTSRFDSSAELSEAGTATWAAQTEAALQADGFDPAATVLPWPKYADDPRGVMGVRVRVGDFSTRDEANAEAATLTTDGFAPLVEWTGFDPTPAPPTRST